ncbi:transporter substrate-binding domain-containing protein [Undibacterium cyanobacteriorum]|uniref:Transporter substrate-binding domain-containing protein n=1 Tax=Undibacterium cyanobacteriorum TaxID=3073561 RepID=A0ABY9RLI7_9BURK|nr:transporter substrate-binding domain-containing protein [Undibacterium sp. 20NA77.5]WMW81826.1 transporter substrate-binding domain-containing protein [Undibacterium sp. 20NA77.5]
MPKLVHAETPTITVTTEYLYPLNMSDGRSPRIFGQAADKVHELFKRGQIPYEMKLMTWNRAFELARQSPNTCVFSTARITERESWFHWIGPIASGNWTIFGRIEKLGKVAQMDDIKGSKIGTEVGNVTVAFLREKDFSVITSNESSTTFKNVALGRIDYAAAGEAHGLKIIKELGLENKLVKLFNFNSSDYYLACNRQMSVETIELLNSKLREMKTDGSYKTLDSKY